MTRSFDYVCVCVAGQRPSVVPDPNVVMLVFSGSRSNVNLTAFPRSSSYLRSLTKCCKTKKLSIRPRLYLENKVTSRRRTRTKLHTLMSALSSVSCSSDMDAERSVSRRSSSALFCRASKIITEEDNAKVTHGSFTGQTQPPLRGTKGLEVSLQQKYNWKLKKKKTLKIIIILKNKIHRTTLKYLVKLK